MKKLVVLLIALKCTFLLAQTEKDILKKDIERFIKANNESAYEAVIKYLPEFNFDSISRNEVLNELKEAYSNNSRSESPWVMDTIFKIDTIMVINSKEYARFYIPQKRTINLSELKNDKGTKYLIESAYNSLVMDYGQENIILKKMNGFFI